MDRTEAARRSAEVECLFDGAPLPEATRRLYATQWRQFVSWCAEEGWLALPARPRTVVLYFVSLLQEGLSSATIKTVSAAIAKGHELAAVHAPTDSPIVRRWRQRYLNGVSDEQRVLPLTPEQMRRIITAMDDDLIDLRDRALLLLAYVLRLRRSALVSLNVEDVRMVPDRVVVLVREKSHLLPPGRHDETCPVRALQTWMQVAALPSGPLFVQVTRWGRPGGRLSGRAIGVIVQNRASAAGLDLKGISADSLHLGSPEDRLLL